jgi:hypothetical protein
MASNYHIEPYDPCPCGSGKKYKFCCAEKARDNRRGQYPIGTIAYYGPDDKTITKIAAGVILREHHEPIIERWTSTTVFGDPKVAEQIRQFFARYGVKKVVDSAEIIGCPHEEGEDFLLGQECPFCPFWAGKQGIVLRSDEDDYEEDEDDEDEIEGDESGDETDAGYTIKIVPPDDEEIEKPEESVARMEAIAGEETDSRSEAVANVLAYLRANLQLPCEVTGIEDFNWEEPYVFGPFDQKEYRALKKTQPSYTDKYQLLSISEESFSKWMMFQDEDITAEVRRISDGKKFLLGLAELTATDKGSRNFKLLDDYSIWFINSR